MVGSSVTLKSYRWDTNTPENALNSSIMFTKAAFTTSLREFVFATSLQERLRFCIQATSLKNC